MIDRHESWAMMEDEIWLNDKMMCDGIIYAMISIEDSKNTIARWTHPELCHSGPVCYRYKNGKGRRPMKSRIIEMQAEWKWELHFGVKQRVLEGLFEGSTSKDDYNNATNDTIFR